MFSALEEIRRLVPIDLSADAPADPESEPSAIQQWDDVIKNLRGLGKQQMRANHSVELLAQDVHAALEEARRCGDALREKTEEYRRENGRLKEAARDSAIKSLRIIDTLDDVTVLARQRRDELWLKYMEGLTRAVLDVFESIGLSEIPSEGRAFNAEEHEALDTVERSGGGQPHQVTEVARRGFRLDGRVIRRAQVTTTR
jgi:molecular chaperone GrpE (heat shock protein)